MIETFHQKLEVINLFSYVMHLKVLGDGYLKDLCRENCIAFLNFAVCAVVSRRPIIGFEVTVLPCLNVLRPIVLQKRKIYLCCCESDAFQGVFS